MIRALTKQMSYANTTVTRYGYDTSGLLTYKFNACGFRGDEFEGVPQLITAGGSISFGIGVECPYGKLLSQNYQLVHWDVSYAQEIYSNQIIHDTIMGLPYYDSILIIQWVSDERVPTIRTMYDLIDSINSKWGKAIHLFMDGAQHKDLINTEHFTLVNPIFKDFASDNQHPGQQTHNGLASFLTKTIHERQFITNPSPISI